MTFMLVSCSGSNSINNITENIPSINVESETKRSESSLKLKNYLDNDPELMSMMEKSINLAHEINPDVDTNPVSNVEELYNFIDWNVKALLYGLVSIDEPPTLYNRIDQSVDYILFLFDQPLDELRDKGYYYPTLQYHEPIASWLYDYSNEWGTFLSVEVVAPADSTPQGLWDIDENSNLIQKEGVNIKAANFISIPQLLGPDSKYSDSFAGGKLTHTFLDVNDYHRYHFPVSGTVVEVNKIKGNNAAGGVTIWDNDLKKYVLIDNILGWQMIKTRDCVIVDTEEYGLVAILPIGMSQICSCNFEDSVKVGTKVNKGDPMGYFLFGGSDIVMLFQNDVNVELLCQKSDEGDGYKHILMGESYIKLSKK